MTSKVALAPHCWGQIVCFSATAKECKTCSQCKSCAVQVRERLEKISTRIEVSSLIRANQAFLEKQGIVLSPVRIELIDGLPGLVGKHDAKFEVEADFSGLSTHAARIATAIVRAGINMANDARHGINQFPKMKFRPEYMASIQALLIDKPTHFDRADVKLAIAKVSDMSMSSLNNTCSFVVSAMLALDFIISIGDGAYALK